MFPTFCRSCFLSILFFFSVTPQNPRLPFSLPQTEDRKERTTAPEHAITPNKTKTAPEDYMIIALQESTLCKTTTLAPDDAVRIALQGFGLSC